MGFGSRASVGGGPRAADRPRRRDLRRLPRRALRPGGPALPLPVHQLHQLRPALHDRPGVPYDRPFTTMAGFEMCAACSGGVRGPARPPLPRSAERMPHLRAVAAPARQARDRGSARRARRAAAEGAILAVKGLGGFHLACLADDEQASRELRAQAPRGQAVRAHGERPGPPAAGRPRRHAESSALARAADRPAPRCRMRGSAEGVAPTSASSG